MPHDLKVRSDVEKELPNSHAVHGGKGQRRCRRCNNHRGFNRMCDINLCRRCLHQNAEFIGFKIYN
ncbi:uncharacterized protein VICG_00294 [Vittaforma corneae ATCC 50505]|uniref:40S ribosomal protein S29 n=1 Tax=Vittaforma corneae (strain ATCC 50505) TaxID=993615 RepID=L2GQD6_VITCO|nr:uncharacterized protein VICG_00294 [Vittaforma corneae ATCC 50505]ELA42542.1 hypothetical protein VICG_00294 [Vittaforma corneae ATCC 50505]